jgi:hypothetical protein
MKFKNIFSITAIMAMLTINVACGGGSDDPEPTPTPTPTVTPPTVLSTTPANGATDIATGSISVQVSYDKDINMFDLEDVKNDMVNGGGMQGYLFRCLHCGRHFLYVDCD